MASFPTWIRYVTSKIDYTFAVAQKSYLQGQFSEALSINTHVRTLFTGKLTFLHRIKEEEMAPTIGTEGGTLLVRKIADTDVTKVYIGDVVMLKDPTMSDKYLVRRLAATKGYEMVSTDEKDEPFVLENDECWVVSDNAEVKPKDSYDSRTFGPVSMTDIVGRVIYCMRNDVDHGPMNNSRSSMKEDSPILAVELDVDELKKNHKE
ncbi:hypothetical protein ACS0TY_013196 [Phlomoides rotata]